MTSSITYRKRLSSLALSTVLAGTLLTGCSTNAAPEAGVSAERAAAAIQQGDRSDAIEHAERAVAGDPRNAGYRAVLGGAYLQAGRFASAATTLDDAMRLGDRSPRTALSLALALAASGKQDESVEILREWQDEIAPADLGLALTLAGRADRGVRVITQAIRDGDGSSKARQNLAYSFAMTGDWRQARLMAEQDLSAGQVDARLGEWARMGEPGAFQARIATMLGVEVGVNDPGQPVGLALNLSPNEEQLARSARDTAVPGTPPVSLERGELSPVTAVGRIDPSAPQSNVSPSNPPPLAPLPGQLHTSAPAQSAVQTMPAAPQAISYPASATPAVAARPATPVTSTIVQSPATPAAGSAQFASARPTPRPAARPSAPSTSQYVETASAVRPGISTQASSPVSGATSHFVQLGSFSSEANARRAIGIYTSRYPELANREMVISEAMVRGRHYWRVSAGGYDTGSARSMCGRVHGDGEGCIAYAAGNPLPGAIGDAVGRVVQVASR